METLVGQSVDRYQIQCLLGEGGMGAVYKATDPLLGRDIAIKLMHSYYASQPEFQQRFLQEARLAARLDHPGIVKVLDSGRANQILYIVMEFIPGENLRKMLAQLKAAGKELSVDEAARLVRQVCLAIDYAHRLGVLYRDIKPDNIMVKEEACEGLPYRPVLTDLGLAKLLEGIPITQEGDALGTPAYMSPEQTQGKTTDVRSDVYSLGVLLYELSVGRLPFEVKTLAEAIRYHTREAPPSPRFLRPDLPVALEGVILKALQKDPERRYPDASSMAADIGQAIPPLIPEQGHGTTAGQGAVSLLTQFRPAPADALGPSIAREFPQPPANLAYDRIQILSAGHSLRTLLVKNSTLLVGRDADCDIVLEDISVSRHHARIEFDGAQYRVIDLKSTNGVYQEGAKLLPGIAETWTPGKTLRIGDHYLQLERSTQPYQHEEEQLPGTTTQVQLAVAEQSMAVLLEEANLKAEPGIGVVTHVTVQNQGQKAGNFKVSIRGLPPEWLAGSIPVVHLDPGEQKRFDMLLRPPRTPDSRAGAYPITVQMANTDAPDQLVEDHATLKVTPFYQFQARLDPSNGSGQEQAVYRVILNNTGNSSLSFQLKGSDLEARCNFHFNPQAITVQSGEERSVELIVQGKSAPVAGVSHTHIFLVGVTPQEKPEAASQLAGNFMQVAPAGPAGVTPVSAEKGSPGPSRQEDLSLKPAKNIFPSEGTPEANQAKRSVKGLGMAGLVLGWMVMLASWILGPWLASHYTGWLFRFTPGTDLLGEIGPDLIFSLIVGVTVGLGTGISLRLMQPSFSFGKVILVTLGWIIAMLIPVLQFAFFPIVPWNIFYPFLIGIIEGLVGGFIMAICLKTGKVKLTTAQVMSISLAWGLGMGIVRFLQDTIGVQYPAFFIIIAVLIAGSWTALQVHRSRASLLQA
jgi:serine/threonine protein kinase